MGCDIDFNSLDMAYICSFSIGDFLKGAKMKAVSASVHSSEKESGRVLPRVLPCRDTCRDPGRFDFPVEKEPGLRGEVEAGSPDGG